MGLMVFFYHWIPLPVVRGMQKWVTFIMGFALNASEGEVVEGGVCFGALCMTCGRCLMLDTTARACGLSQILFISPSFFYAECK
jgi:hypothetical protein